MKGRFWIFVILCIFFLSGCFGAETVSLGETVPLFRGETIRFEESGLSIRFVEVIEDSRCPEDVFCPWEGRVVIMLEIKKDQNREIREISLQPSQLPHEEDIDGLLLTISAFGPPKKSDQDIESSQYHLVLSLAKR